MYFKFFIVYILFPYPSILLFSLFALEVILLSPERPHGLHRLTLACVGLHTGLSNLGYEDILRKLECFDKQLCVTLMKGFIRCSSAMVEGTVGCGGEAERICWHQDILSLIC